MARVAALESDDPGVTSDACVQLAVADVDRIDPGRASGEQRLREPTGRCADVQGNDALHRKPEVVEACGEFQAATRHEGRNALGEGDCLRSGNFPSGLGCDGAADQHAATLDQITRA